MQKHTSSLNAYTNCFSCLREMWWVDWDGGQWVGVRVVGWVVWCGIGVVLAVDLIYVCVWRSVPLRCCHPFWDAL
jgi:hypothetical protein